MKLPSDQEHNSQYLLPGLAGILPPRCNFSLCRSIGTLSWRQIPHWRQADGFV